MSAWQIGISSASALVGVIIGNGLSWRAERRGWQRDRKFDVYRGVTSAARTLLWRGDEIDVGRTDMSLSQQRNLVREAMFQLREELAEVALVAQGQPTDAALALEGHFGNVLYPYFFGSETADTNASQVVEARRLITKFQAAARQDLAKI